MATLIDEYLATSNTDEIVRTALAKKYKSLENRSDLLKNMRSGLLSPSYAMTSSTHVTPQLMPASC